MRLSQSGSGALAAEPKAASEARRMGSRPDPDVRAAVNSASQRASNREARQAEAEQDRALIEKAKLGDKAAFRELVERHQRRAFAIAVGLVRDENDAREVVQEAFLRVYRGLDAFHGGSSFFTWLYRIVTNLAIDLMRKPARREAELDEGRKIEDEQDLPLLARIDGADPVDVVRRSEIFQEAGLVGEVRFLTARTVYASLGDVVPWTACGMLGMGLLVVAALIAVGIWPAAGSIGSTSPR